MAVNQVITPACDSFHFEKKELPESNEQNTLIDFTLVETLEQDDG